MEKRLPLPIGTVLQGRYRILRQLGHGGFGAVYEAVDDDINLSFALKETFYSQDEDLRQAFKREARILASLSHDAFPRVSHYFTEGDGCFLVMELIRGDDLDKLLLARPAPFETEQVLSWANQILDALEDLHAGGIVHRDIKPANLKLTPKGKIKLLDFGIAKGTLEGETAILTTIGSLAAATLQYAPLEQVLKASVQHQMMLSVVSPDKVSEIMKRGTDAASDLYSLAATLYHLLTGHLPVDAPTRALAVWSRQSDRLVAPDEFKANVSKEISEVLLKAMSLDRNERFQSAADMRQVLNAAAQSAAKKIVLPTEPMLPNEPEIVPFISDKNKSAKKTQTIPFRTLVDKLKNRSLPKRSRLGLILTIIALPLLLIMLVSGLFFKSCGTNFGSENTNRANSNISGISNTNAKPTNIISNARYVLSKTFTESGSVDYITLSPDGRTVAYVVGGNEIKLRSVINGSLIRTFLKEHDGSIYSLAFSPDGKYVASGGEDKTVKLWNVESGKSETSFTDSDSKVSSVAFSPSEKKLAIGNYNGKIYVWNLDSGSTERTLSTHKKRIGSIAFSSDGRMASGSDDSSIILWKNNSIYPDQTFIGFTSNIYTVAFSPDRKKIAGGGYDNTIRIWNAEDGSFIRGFRIENYTYCIKFSPDGKNLIYGLTKGKTNSDLTEPLPTVTPTPIPTPTPTPTPVPTPTASSSPAKPVFNFPAPSKTKKPVSIASPTPTPEYYYQVVLFDVESGKIKQTLSGHTDAVYSIDISGDGMTLISGGKDKTIKIWRAE